jgi:hypothetical protein
MWFGGGEEVDIASGSSSRSWWCFGSVATQIVGGSPRAWELGPGKEKKRDVFGFVLSFDALEPKRVAF